MDFANACIPLLKINLHLPYDIILMSIEDIMSRIRPSSQTEAEDAVTVGGSLGKMSQIILKSKNG